MKKNLEAPKIIFIIVDKELISGSQTFNKQVGEIIKNLYVLLSREGNVGMGNTNQMTHSCGYFVIYLCTLFKFLMLESACNISMPQVLVTSL